MRNLAFCLLLALAGTGHAQTEALAPEAKPTATALAPVMPGAPGPDASAARNPFPSEGPLFDTFRDTAYELRCPTCTGLSVLDSDAAFSVQIRDLVKEQVQAGKSKSEILNFFTDRYGAWILRAPPARGVNALAWALPLGLLFLGPPLVWFFVWRKRKVVGTIGMRAGDEILAEMNTELALLRAKMGTST